MRRLIPLALFLIPFSASASLSPSAAAVRTCPEVFASSNAGDLGFEARLAEAKARAKAEVKKPSLMSRLWAKIRGPKPRPTAILTVQQGEITDGLLDRFDEMQVIKGIYEATDELGVRPVNYKKIGKRVESYSTRSLAYGTLLVNSNGVELLKWKDEGDFRYGGWGSDPILRLEIDSARGNIKRRETRVDEIRLVRYENLDRDLHESLPVAVVKSANELKAGESYSLFLSRRIQPRYIRGQVMRTLADGTVFVLTEVRELMRLEPGEMKEAKRIQPRQVEDSGDLAVATATLGQFGREYLGRARGWRWDFDSTGATNESLNALKESLAELRSHRASYAAESFEGMAVLVSDASFIGIPGALTITINHVDKLSRVEVTQDGLIVPDLDRPIPYDLIRGFATAAIPNYVEE